MVENVITIKDVSMNFIVEKERSYLLKDYIIRKMSGRFSKNKFTALKDITFSLDRGDSLALIGANGSGKSTLLKLIAGILVPSTGNIQVNGKISPLIELGAGFDVDLTARENVFLNGLILGYSKKFIELNFQKIIDFAELWEFIDVPLKNFSSGMSARLGFAIATIAIPDILILDEVLSVGDMNFQQKCEKRIREMLTENTTVIFVSHSDKAVREICKKAIWLNNGIIEKYGEVNEVCDAYIMAESKI
jgi:ABC-type polysaccharide/polyol phosphate transport system ATPase subunit